MPGWELPIWAQEVDKFDAYLQLQALDAETFPDWSGHNPAVKMEPHMREGNRMRQEYREALVQRATGGQQTTRKHIPATGLKDLLGAYGFSA